MSGVIFLGGNYSQTGASHEHYERLHAVNLPTVLMNAGTDGLGFATVSTDDTTAAEQAVRHLNQLGHRRIGMLLGPADHVPSERKLAGARRVLAELGEPLDDALVVRGCTRSSPVRRAPPGCSRTERRRSSARATSWRSGPSAQCGAPVGGCPRTSASSATTTRRS